MATGRSVQILKESKCHSYLQKGQEEGSRKLQASQTHLDLWEGGTDQRFMLPYRGGINRLEKWIDDKDLMKFNVQNCKVMHLWRNNPRYQHKVGATQLESSSAEKDLGIVVYT